MAGDTFCKNAGICSSQAQNANPFGLWFNREQCYGAFNNVKKTYENFCYFDRTNTVVDACLSCVNLRSCFDYKGKDACLTNNCLVGGVAGNCEWVDSSVELGTGYCVQSNYSKTDKCSECSASGQLFKNAFCSSNVCDKLGACFANAGQNSCVACSAGSSCYDFVSQQECVGGKPASFSFGILQPSADACSLGVCKFDANASAASACFKDGNGDNVDDCAAFAGSVLFNKCRRDNIAPVTSAVQSVISVNASFGSTAFRAVDSNGAKRLFYCIDRANTCLPNATNFVFYNSSNEAKINFVFTELKQIYSGAGDYILRFQSEDTFFNRENIKGKRFTADLFAPQFLVLNSSVKLNASGSALIFNIGLDEQARCSDKLRSYNTGDFASQLSGNRSDSFVLAYGGLADGLYKYEISCSDDGGNTAASVLDLIEVDAIGFVNIISPPKATRQTTFSFVVNTSNEASCQLFDGNNLVEGMSTNNFFIHASTQKTFSTNTFFFTWKVKCRELGPAQRLHEKIIPFTIDELAPVTTIKFTTGEGLVQAYSTSGWEAKIKDNASVSFVCNDLPLNGFGCNVTKHCFTNPGGDCLPTVTAVPGIVKNDSGICFLSADNAGAQELKKCGKITIAEDFGISLVKPKFGVSDSATFDLAIGTLIPSESCKWAAADFDFDKLVSQANTFTRINPFLFEKQGFTELLPDFPEKVNSMNIFVKCKAQSGRISPSEVFELAYDPSAPRIVNLFADPSQVIQGNSVDLIAETDDKTICKYDKVANFAAMSGKFAGFDGADFRARNVATIGLSASDDGKSHTYNVVCMNRAQNLSSAAAVSFSVDFSASGTIVDKKPSGAINNVSAFLSLRTNRDAICENLKEQDFIKFNSTGGINHTQFVANLTEGAYSFHVRCKFVSTGVIRTDIVSFKVDLTPPELLYIDDGSASCGLGKVGLVFNSTDNVSSVKSYDYRLFAKFDDLQVANGTAFSNSLNVTGLNLSEGKEYFIKAVAMDEAGNSGVEVVSDGFVAAKNESACVLGNVAAVARGLDGDGDGVVNALDKCPDTAFGEQVDVDGCSALQLTVDTDGDRLPDSFEFRHDASECELDLHERDSDGDSVEDGDEDYDNDGAVNFDEYKERTDPCVASDSDEDGVFDNVDSCRNTPFAERASVDAKGCGPSERDTDGDGMDDAFESKFCGGNCDPNEDLDGDGLNNLEEYNVKKIYGMPSDPTQKDTDGDGWNDKKELNAGTNPVDASSRPSSKVLPVLLLVLGLLLVAGGGGYLVYVSKFGKEKVAEQPYVAQERAVRARVSARQAEQARKYGEFRKVFERRKIVEEKAEAEKRRKVFEAFGFGGVSGRGGEVKRETKGEAKPLPELARVIRSEEKSDVEKLGELARKYAAQKRSISARLSEEEKGVFERLEKLGKEAGGRRKGIQELVGKGGEKELQSIFDQLVQVVKEHEGEGTFEKLKKRVSRKRK